MRCTTLLALLTGVILYLVMGALVFSTLESPDERLAYTNLLAAKNTFLDNKSCVTELDFHRLVKVPPETPGISRASILFRLMEALFLT